MSAHVERVPDLVRERTIADREAEQRLYPREHRSGSVERTAPLHQPAVGGHHAQHGAARPAAAANVRVMPADRDFAAPPSPALANGGQAAPRLAATPLNKNAPAADATAPARRPEGSKDPMGVTHDTREADGLTITVECLRALVDSDSTLHPAADASVSSTVHVKTVAQFDAIIAHATRQGFHVHTDRVWPCERAGNQRFAVIGKAFTVYCPVDAPVGEAHVPTAAELEDIFRPEDTELPERTRLQMVALAAAGVARVYSSYDRPAVQYCDVLAVDAFGADVRWHRNGARDRMPLNMLHPAPRRPEAA